MLAQRREPAAAERAANAEKEGEREREGGKRGTEKRVRTRRAENLATESLSRLSSRMVCTWAVSWPK
jgi:uncharacterized membrane protein YccC